MNSKLVKVLEREIQRANFDRKEEAAALAQKLREHLEEAEKIMTKLETDFPDVLNDLPPQL